MTLDLLDTTSLETNEQIDAAQADAEAGHRAACERTVAGGHCTTCGTDSPELLPWGRERVCWACFDGQLDLMAQAIQAASPGDHLVFGDSPEVFEAVQA